MTFPGLLITCCLFLSTAADTAPGPAAPPNILLLSVDTLRADHLGCYGYPHPTSPHIDALAEKSLCFTDCVCEVPLTAPSMGSMLTSRYPRLNGNTRNGLRIPDQTPTVAERLRAAGYQTFCVQSNWTLKAKLSGLDRGFEIYEESFRKKRWGFMKAERPAEEVTKTALRLLEDRDSAKPFFAWIHYTDPHAPYKLHRKFNPQNKKTHRASETDRARIRYDSEIAYTDDQIGRLLAALPENTRILFTADHGESLYEHDYLGHGRRLYQPSLHIPLLLRLPGEAPRRIAAPVRGVDIGVTLLALAGLSPAPGMIGIDLRQAERLDARDRVVETYGGAVPNIPGVKDLMADAGPMRQAVLTPDGWKLILGGPKTELFHLPEDSGEIHNLAQQQPEKVLALKGLIDAWSQHTVAASSAGVALDKEDIRALESLGYLE